MFFQVEWVFFLSISILLTCIYFVLLLCFLSIMHYFCVSVFPTTSLVVGLFSEKHMLAQVFTKPFKDYIKVLWIIVKCEVPNKYSYIVLCNLQALILYCIFTTMQEFLYQLSSRIGKAVIFLVHYGPSCLVILVQEGNLIE